MEGREEFLVLSSWFLVTPLGMQLFTHILATDDTDGLAKIVIGVIVFIFWGIGALASALKNKSQQAPLPRVANPPPIELTPNMEIAPRRPVMARPPPLRPGARPVTSPPRRAVPRLVTAPAMQPVQQRLSPPPLAAAPAPVARAVITNPAPPTTTARVSPASLLANKLRPESLRTQWLLTEVLAKPLALREIDRIGPH